MRTAPPSLGATGRSDPVSYTHLLVIIGLYPQATVDWLLENMPKMKKGCVVVDMVGVKQFMVERLEQAALDAGVHFVGGHPMAGREFSGCLLYTSRCV